MLVAGYIGPAWSIINTRKGPSISLARIKPVTNVLPFVHRPVSRYVNALADHGLVLRRMHEPAPPEEFLKRAAEYRQAATIPRLLVLVVEREPR